jgi:ferredoxin
MLQSAAEVTMHRLPRVLAYAVATFLAALAGIWVFGERGRLLRPSTREWFRGGWRFLPQRIHGYVYGRWSNQYIGIAISRIRARPQRAFQSNSADHYHGKVLPHALARQVITLNHDLDLRDQEQVIPYPVARDIVLRHPEALAVYDCPCRATRANPCQPADVCMIIGEPFVSFVLEHNPQSARAVSRQEMLDILEAEHRRGHVHTAYFKDAMEGRFYAICNCCSCCCGGIESMVRGGVPMIASSGYVAQIAENACTGCGLCQEVCPFRAVHLEASASGKLVARVDEGKCMGCGACEARCQFGVPILIRDRRKPIPMDIAALEGARPFPERL